MQNKKKLIAGIAAAAVVAVALFFYSQRVTYTEEFTYLPEVRGMEVEEHQKAKDGQVGNAVYMIDGKEYKDFLTKYEKILVKDGWKITKQNKPQSLEAEKGEHTARIHVEDSQGKLTVLMWTK